MKQEETSLVKQFVKTQMKDLKKKDWGKTVMKDLEELKIQLSIQEIEALSKNLFKTMIKRKIKERAFQYLVNKKITRNGKGIEINHSRLEMQNYLKSENIDITNDERKLIFQYRTRMNFNIKSHFRNMYFDTICDGCRVNESTTRHTLECPSLLGGNEIVTYIPYYEDLFGDDEEEQVYIARLIRNNCERLPVPV